MPFQSTESSITMTSASWLRGIAWAMVGLGAAEVAWALAAGHWLFSSTGLSLVLLGLAWLRVRVHITDTDISWTNGGLQRSLPFADVEALEVDYTRNQVMLRTSERTIRVHAPLPSDFDDRGQLERFLDVRVPEVATVPARERKTARS